VHTTPTIIGALFTTGGIGALIGAPGRRRWPDARCAETIYQAVFAGTFGTQNRSLRTGRCRRLTVGACPAPTK
jgi:hypothetical protein